MIETLNRLVETCTDSEHGFRTAAASVKSPRLEQLFTTYAHQRAEYARQLQREVASLGGDPETAGSVSGSLHRGWMNIKSAVGMGDRAILNEAERREDIARQVFEEALREALPAGVHALIERRLAHVREAHDTVRNPREAEAA